MLFSNYFFSSLPSLVCSVKFNKVLFMQCIIELMETHLFLRISVDSYLYTENKH